MHRRRFAGALGGLAILPALDGGSARTSYKVVKDGHGPGRDMAVISWRASDGKDIGEVDVPFASPATAEGSQGRIGPVAIRIAALGSVPNAFEWDTREWQWWKGYPRPFGARNDEYVRLVPATGGAEQTPWGVRVWSRYVSDGVETRQDWLFPDLAPGAEPAYDCVIAVRNRGEAALEEYGQFFASYVAWNEGKGHYYWADSGDLINFADRGSRHLDYFVTAAGSTCARLGRVPHCARGGGKVKALWRKPVSVSIAGPAGLHHVQMTEEAFTSAIGMGARGPAQDYILAPRGLTLARGAVFRAHVRHIFGSPSKDGWPETLDAWWRSFAASHRRTHSLITGKGTGI